jgi:hypothetical protein
MKAPTVTLTLLDCPKGNETMILEGRSSKPFVFVWNSKAGRYVHENGTQDDIDDLMWNAGLMDIYRISVLVPENLDPVAQIPPLPIAPEAARGLARSQAASLLHQAGLHTSPKEETSRICRAAEALLTGYALALRKHALVVPVEAGDSPAS